MSDRHTLGSLPAERRVGVLQERVADFEARARFLERACRDSSNRVAVSEAWDSVSRAGLGLNVFRVTWPREYVTHAALRVTNARILVLHSWRAFCVRSTGKLPTWTP